MGHYELISFAAFALYKQHNIVCDGKKMPVDANWGIVCVDDIEFWMQKKKQIKNKNKNK